MGIGIKLLFLSILLFNSGMAQNRQKLESSAAGVWDIIASDFSVPEVFSDDYGQYRSPLKFYNGKKGKTPKDWQKRKKENPSRGLYPKLIKEGYDLTELHTLIAPRPFFVSGGSEDLVDRWKALNHTIAVNKLLGYEHRVGLINRPEHFPNQESNEHICMFLEYFLMYGADHPK